MIISPASARAATLTLSLDSPANGSSTNQTTPAFSGVATTDKVDSVSVAVYLGSSASGTPVQTLTAAPNPTTGDYSATPTSPLAEGTYTAEATQTDGLGDSGQSTANTFTVDTTPPTVTITSPANGSSTNSTTPTFSGTAGTATGDLPGITVAIYSGSTATGTPVQTLTTNASGGTWSVAPTTALPEGTYTAQASQSDQAGNTGFSTPSTFTVDTTPPTLTLTSPASGSSTNSTTPTFSGTAGTATGDLSTITLTIYSGNTATGTPVQTLTTTASGGSYSVAPTTALAQGIYTAQASQSDQAGNTGHSAANTFTVDTVAPTVTLTDPANGSTTNSNKPTFAGTAGTATGDLSTITVTIYSGGTATGTPVQTLTTTASGGSYSVAPTTSLPDGTYTAQASQSDQAGNTGHSTAQTFTVDTVAPTVTLTDPANGSATNSNKPTFDGTAGTATGDLPAITVNIYSGGGATGTPVQTLTTTASGSTWTVAPTTALPDGTYTAQASQSDQAGNTGHSTAHTFTVDTVAPTVTLTDPANGSSTSATKPIFDGTAGTATGDLSTISIDVYAGSSTSGSLVDSFTTKASGGSYSAPSPAALSPGTYTTQASQSDQAGNTGHSTPNTFTVQAAPTDSTQAANPVGYNTADLNGIVNPNGADTTIHFEYGPSTSYGSSTPSQDVGSGFSPMLVSASLTNLSPSTTYHFRIVATNSVSTTDGSDQTFTTAPAPGPLQASFTTNPASPFGVGAPVQFTSTSSDPNASIVNYDWQWGDGTPDGSGPSPSHTFSKDGTFSVTLTVTDNYGNTNSVTNDVVVSGSVPTASFTPPGEAPTDTTLSFDGSGSTTPNPGATITGYDWNWGDGTPDGSGPKLTHSYAKPGTYPVTLTVTDSAGNRGSVTHDVIVSPRQPTAAFNPTSATVLAGSPVQFNGTPSSDPDGTISSYSWNFGDGGTSTSAQPSHTYMNIGTFTVSLTVTDNFGNKATVSHPITVIAPPPLQTLIETPLAAPALVKGSPPSITRLGLVKLGQRAFCPGPGVACTVTVTATTSVALVRTAHLASARRVGRSQMTIASKQSAALTFRLSKLARSYLRKHGRLPLRVTIVVQRGTLSTRRTQSFTLH